MLGEIINFEKELKKTYKLLLTFPLSYFKNLDLNSETFNGSLLPGGTSLVMIMALARSKESEPTLLENFLEAYPSHIGTLDFHKKTSHETEPGLCLGFILSRTSPALLKKIIHHEPQYAMALDLRSTCTNKNHLSFGVDLSWFLACNLHMYTLLDDILSLHPPQMASINLNAHPLNKNSILGNSNYSVAWGLLLYKPDLLDQIIKYHPAHLKTLQLDAKLTLPDEEEQIFFTVLFNKNKVEIIAKLMLETEQKIPVENFEIMAALYSQCKSLNDIYILMRNYTEEEFDILLSDSRTQDLTHICLLYSKEFDIYEWHNNMRDKPISADDIQSFFSKAAEIMAHFDKLKDPFYKDLHTIKVTQLLTLIKSFYAECLKQEQDIPDFLWKSVLPNVYADTSNFLSPKDFLPIMSQIDFEVLWHLKSSRFSLEYANYLTSALLNTGLKQQIGTPTKTALLFHTPPSPLAKQKCVETVLNAG